MNKPNFDTFIISDLSLFQRLQTYASKVDSEYLAFDVETDGGPEKTTKLWGLGLAFTENKAFYIPFKKSDGTDYWSNLDKITILNWLKSIIPTKKIIGHNLVYDVLVFENNTEFNIEQYIHADTILMRHCLNEEGPFALKEIAAEVLGSWAVSAQEDLKQEVLEAGGKWSVDQKDMFLASTETLGRYCCFDVILTYLLYQQFNQKLEEENLVDLFYKDEVMPLYKEVTINMKRKGFPVDVEYFKKLKSDIQLEITKLEDEIINEIKPKVANFESHLLDEQFPVNNKGNFPKKLAEVLNIPLPVNKEGKITLSKKALEAQLKLTPQFVDFYNWVETGEGLNKFLGKSVYSNNNPIRKAQEILFFDKHPDQRFIFNLKSNEHLAELFCNIWGLPALEKTEKTGKPKINEDFLENYKGNEIVSKLLDLKKLNKILSTYIDGILDRQLDGIIYTSMLQFGTTSGRFSSRNPNCQNLPRIKDEEAGLSTLVLNYTNAIRRGFIANKGYKIVNTDYSSLEPICFAEASGDEKLKSVFRNGEDLYSRVGIETFGLVGVSAKKSDPNYLKNIMPEKRQTAKVIALAIPYGAEAARISKELNISFLEGEEIVSNYLKGFPDLKKYMAKCDYLAKTKGEVRTMFGRVRHLKEARSIYTLYGDKVLEYKWAKKSGYEDIRRKFKNALNNSKNFPIQGLAAHIVNRAMISIARKFKQNNIDGWISLQVHDEITCIVNESQADLAAKIVQDCMENTTKISVPLTAEPLIADNWGDAK